MRRGGSQGFTLLEVMIALAILAFGLLTLLAMQVGAMKQGSRGTHVTAAAAIARDQYERIPRMPFSSAELQPTAGWQVPPWINNAGFNPGEVPVQTTTADATVHTERVYAVWYRVTADPGGNPDLRDVDLEVTWSEENEKGLQPTRTGLPTVAFSGVIVDNDL